MTALSTTVWEIRVRTRLVRTSIGATCVSVVRDSAIQWANVSVRRDSAVPGDMCKY